MASHNHISYIKKVVSFLAKLNVLKTYTNVLKWNMPNHLRMCSAISDDVTVQHPLSSERKATFHCPTVPIFGYVMILFVLATTVILKQTANNGKIPIKAKA